jgi:cysteine dioxygenase
MSKFVWTSPALLSTHEYSHAKAHCIMKILKGKLTETRYATPPEGDNDTENGPLEVLAKTTYEANQVTYMSDKLGIHRISNPDEDNYAVSLHRKLSRSYTAPDIDHI